SKQLLRCCHIRSESEENCMHALARQSGIPTTIDAVASRAVSWPAALLGIGFMLALTATPAVGAGAYVDAVDYPGSGQGWKVFRDLERRLVRNFDDICGDTICEGEFSNLQALRYRCSVRQADSAMGQCVWTFAGSNAEINPTTGKVMVDARTWACRT